MTGSELIDGLAEVRAARAKGDKTAVEAACQRLDEYTGSMETLFRFLDERRKKVKATGTVEQIIEWIERESRRPSRWSQATWGMMSEDFEFEAMRRWLEEGTARERPLPLSKAAALIYKRLLSLKPHEAMLTSEIQDWYEKQTGTNLDEGTWKNLRREMESHGLQNRRRVGYYIDPKK